MSIAVVESAFQLLCILSLLEQEENKKIDVILPYLNDKNRNCLLVLLNKYNLSYISLKKTITIFDLISQVLPMFNKYDKVYVGDYYSINQSAIASIIAKRKAQVIYVDDGSSSIKIIEGNVKRGTTIKSMLAHKLFYSIAKIKMLSFAFYSIFVDSIVETKMFKIERNTLSILSKTLNTIEKGIYIIGTVPNLLGYTDIEYYRIIRTACKYLRCRYPDEDVFFCPHRRDLSDYRSILFEENILLFQTQISVEFDMILNNIYPRAVLGFGSTALYTLKKLYPNSNVASVKLNTGIEELDKEYKKIEELYSFNQISIIEF